METKKRPSLLKSTGMFGVRTLLRLGGVLLMFVALNLIIFIYALSALSELNILWKLVVPFLGIVFTALACLATYRAVLVDGIAQIYDQTTAIWQKLCKLVVNKVNSDTAAVSKSIDVGDILEGLYEDKAPKVLRRGMNLVLSFVPIASMALDMKEIIKTSDHDVAANMLYNRVDKYIKEEIFTSKMHLYIGAIAIINIIVQVVYIFIVSK